MPGAENDTGAMIQLGRRLYFEKKLSKNQTQSCNTCHVVDNGGAGVDNQPTSPGAFGKRGDRNSPTTWNAGFHLAQFWDGRAEDLVAQAKGPVLNPIEMAMPAEAEVIARLLADSEYPAQFRAAFPDAPPAVNYENMARAIAAFERTLITRDRFDDFLKGTDTALTQQEIKGLNTFLAVGCTTCHNGPLLGGNSYQKLGLVKPYGNQRDIGRAAVTKEEGDAFKFKVPTLRNIAATQPYFHDGQVSSLAEAVREMGSIQLGLQLTDEQVTEITAFLNALTGKEIKLTRSQPASAAGSSN
jgi:cytochrome c peroxidase